MINVLEEVTRYASQDDKEGLHDLRDDGMVYPYYDPVGFPTIGYGNLLSSEKWADLSQWECKTIDECFEDLMKEMQVKMNYATQLSPCLTEEINGWRLVAITDFIYNIGQGAYEKSTLRKKVNVCDWDGAVIEIKRWNRAGGKVLKGLDIRRKEEAEMLLKDA